MAYVSGSPVFNPMKPILLLALVLASGSALAQVPLARYQPLSVGDFHAYGYYVAETWTSTACPAQQLRSYETTRVVADTLVDGQAGFVVTCMTTTANMGTTRINRYAVRVSANGALTVATVRNGGGCALLGTFVPAFSGTMVTEPGSVTVGGMSYAVPGVRQDRFSGSGSGQTVGGTDQVLAADLGLVSDLNYQSRGLPPQYCRQYRRELVAASVSGRQYGAIVAGEAEPTASVRLSVSAVPNPSAGAVTLQLAAAEAVEASVDVFDALGRRVGGAASAVWPAGTSEVRVDGTAWAPGVYVVRVTGRDGQTATARIVRSN